MKIRFTLLALTACGLVSAGSASAQVTPYIGEVRLFGFNFCPVGWTPANGALLSIQQNTALFSLYGTYYGGNGVNNFALPNLQERSPTGADSNRPIGQLYGASVITLTQSQLPMVQPQLRATTTGPTTNSPNGAMIATEAAGEKVYAAAGSPANVNMSASAIAPFGGGQPVSVQSPALAMTWCVALTGVFPPRN